jgi:hypothetical protein
MGNNFFVYVQQLEMLAFFSGYPLIYFLIRFLTHNTNFKNGWEARIVSILPFAYALTGTLYLGLQIINLYPDYTIDNIKHRFQQPYLNIWAVLSILFWIPAISKKQVLSILHSLVFFFLVLRDLFFQFTWFSQNRDILKNDMRMYTVSIFLNLAAVTVLVLLYFLLPFRKKSQHHDQTTGDSSGLSPGNIFLTTGNDVRNR